LAKFFERIFDICASVRLTVVLLLSLAAVAIFGTIWPSREEALEAFRFELFYQSPWFRLLLLLLAINIIVCTVRLVGRRLGQQRRWLVELPAQGGVADSRPASDLEAGFRRLGFRSRATPYGYYLWRGTVGRWSVVGVHLSVLLIMAGALAGSLGFVATLNIYSGDSSRHFFDWDAQQDRPIGFTFRLDHFEPRYYPIELKFAVIDPMTGQSVEEIVGAVGETVSIPSLGLEAGIERFDPIRQRLELELSRDGRAVGRYEARGGERDPSNTVAGHVLYPVAFRDPRLRQYYSEVSILEQGRVVHQGVIQINHPLKYRGVWIYQTAFRADDDGRLYAGFQFVKDPGANLVWGGCIMFVLFLCLNGMVRFRAVGLEQGDVCRLVPLAGLKSRDGAHSIEALSERLNSEGTG